MKMRFPIAVVLAVAIGLAGAADNPVLRTRTLALEFAPGWQLALDGNRAEGHGPDGESIIMNIRALLPDAPADAVERHWQGLRGFATNQMPGIAAAHQNEVRRPLTETALPGGRVQFSTVSQGKKMFRDYYFLQYLLGSRHTLAYVTVEGYGNAEAAARRFERILATQQWSEDSPSPIQTDQ
jgi:hypothetical protein